MLVIKDSEKKSKGFKGYFKYKQSQKSTKGKYEDSKTSEAEDSKGKC